MLETFKVRLKAKSTAAGANLSQKRIDAIADRLNKKFPDLKEETEHDEQIDVFYEPEDFKELATVDDYQRTKEAKEKKDKERKAKEKAEKSKSKEKEKSADDDEEEEEESGDDKMPSWFKPFADKLEVIDKKDKTQSLHQKLKEHEKLKDVPEDFWSERKMPETDDEIEGFVEKASTQWSKIAPTPTGAFAPQFGEKGSKKVSEKQIENIVDHIMPK